MSKDHQSQRDGLFLSKSAARALDFDARVTPSNTLQKAHALLNSTLRNTMEALVGTALREEEYNIVSAPGAPGPLGRCSLRAPSNTIADAALMSSRLCPTEAAEDEKHKRYGPRVTPIAFSTCERLRREGRKTLEALAAEARWNSDDPTRRNQVAKWRKTLEENVLHAQTDVLLWQQHAGTPLGKTAYNGQPHLKKLTDEQVATIRANRAIAEARREALRAE